MLYESLVTFSESKTSLVCTNRVTVEVSSNISQTYVIAEASECASGKKRVIGHWCNTNRQNPTMALAVGESMYWSVNDCVLRQFWDESTTWRNWINKTNFWLIQRTLSAMANKPNSQFMIGFASNSWRAFNFCLWQFISTATPSSQWVSVVRKRLSSEKT